MIQSRRRFLVCAGLAVAGGTLSRRSAPRRARRHPVPPHERAYGLIEDIDDRQLGEFVAGTAAVPGDPSYRARPG